MYTYSAWMPCKRKHDLSNSLRYLKALAQSGAAAFEEYQHVKGRIIATMNSAALAELKTQIVRLADGISAADLPDDVARIVVELRGPDPAPVIPFPVQQSHDAMIEECAALEAA